MAASSNRHWPSIFKSKPTTSHHQWQYQDRMISSPGYQRAHSYSPGTGLEERTPEPKPRWNPRPEQIRILEAIFNSGMVNPPRDEIRRIRVQLQEYGQVGDANVFYWFQNRKSRSKHKQRQLQNAAAAAASSSSSSSPNNSKEKPISQTTESPPTGFHLAPGFLFPDIPGSSFLLNELMPTNQFPDECIIDENIMKLHQNVDSVEPSPVPSEAFAVATPSSVTLPFPTNLNLQGVGAPPTMSTVFINDVCFEVGAGPFNVREAFGDDAVLVHPTGHPVLTNEWGDTLLPLQHGGSYYLLLPLTALPPPLLI